MIHREILAIKMGKKNKKEREREGEVFDDS